MKKYVDQRQNHRDNNEMIFQRTQIKSILKCYWVNMEFHVTLLVELARISVSITSLALSTTHCVLLNGVVQCNMALKISVHHKVFSGHIQSVQSRAV